MSLIGSEAADEMAVEWETSEVRLLLFLLVYTIEWALSQISRSDEDLTARVDLACSVWAFGMICAIVCVCVLWLEVGPLEC